MARAWYAYVGDGAINQPANYIYISLKPLCRNGCDLCAIYACYGGFNPCEISENLQLYIANALATCIAQPQYPIFAKKYVYMRT